MVQRWAIALQYIEQFRIILFSFEMSAPVIQRDCPTMVEGTWGTRHRGLREGTMATC